MRARVRVLRDHQSGAVDPRGELHWRAGSEHILVLWEAPPGGKAKWATSYDIDGAYLIPQDMVEVIEVLEP